MTEDFHKLVGELDGMKTEWRTESYNDVGQIRIKVYYPEMKALETFTPTFLQSYRVNFKSDLRAIRYALGTQPPTFGNLQHEKVSLREYFGEIVAATKKKLKKG